jgi:hypothetical protein
VTGAPNRRVSLAALIATRPGCRPRLIYRTHLAGRRDDRRKGLTETDYARFLDAAHQQLGGPVVLVWDNVNTHVSRAMRELIAARSWLTVCQLPAYAPELNPGGDVVVLMRHLSGSGFMRLFSLCLAAGCGRLGPAAPVVVARG